MKEDTSTSDIFDQPTQAWKDAVNNKPMNYFKNAYQTNHPDKCNHKKHSANITEYGDIVCNGCGKITDNINRIIKEDMPEDGTSRHGDCNGCEQCDPRFSIAHRLMKKTYMEGYYHGKHNAEAPLDAYQYENDLWESEWQQMLEFLRGYERK